MVLHFERAYPNLGSPLVEGIGRIGYVPSLRGPIDCNSSTCGDA